MRLGAQALYLKKMQDVKFRGKHLQVITFVHLEQVIEKSMKVPQDLKSLKNTTQFFFQTIQPLSKSPCVEQNLFGPSMQTTSKLLLLINKSQVCDAQYYKIT